MKKLVRNSVFETNSSSCHSISIADKVDFNDVPSPNAEGNIHITSGEFGWEEDSYRGFFDKASYLAVYIRDWAKEEKESFKQIFENLIKETTACYNITYEDSFWDFEERSYKGSDGNQVVYQAKLGYGYIDHQSVEDKDLHYLFTDVDKLKAFLFCSNSILETDNDNH